MEPNLLTPILLKSQKDMPWSGERVFYILAQNGLFVCRNHDHFQSCVPAKNWPSELAEQETFLHLNYPKIPRKLMESLVGFFDFAASEHGAEAGALLTWNSKRKQIEILIPKQRATIGRTWRGDVYPIGLHYESESPLTPGTTIIGDVHSHADDPAYASVTDKRDEIRLFLLRRPNASSSEASHGEACITRRP